MTALWKCPRCRRSFRQVNQRHSCGVGDREVLAGRPPALLKLYRALESLVKGLPGVEIVVRERYALFRTSRIFADVVFGKDALRLAIHLDGKVADPAFFKVQEGRRGQVAHVAKLRSLAEVRAMAGYLHRAHAFSRAESV